MGYTRLKVSNLGDCSTVDCDAQRLGEPGPVVFLTCTSLVIPTYPDLSMPSSKLPSPLSDAVPDLSILSHRLALDPSVTSSKPPDLPHSPQTSPEQPLLESYARFRSSPFDALREFTSHVSGTGWRSYDTIVGQEIFYNGFSDQMKRMVMQSPLLQAKVTQLAQRRVGVEEAEGSTWEDGGRVKREQEIIKQLNEVAAQWTDQMICKMESRRFIRGAYYLCTQLLTRAYHQGTTTLPGTNHGHYKGADDIAQAYTSQVRRSFVFARLPKKQPKRINQLFSFHVIVLMSTMFLCSSSATAWD